MLEIPWPIKPIKFHPYRSYVLDRVFVMDSNNETEYLREELINTFNEAGIKCYNDNKIVFECEINKIKVYYGFYDNKFSIGLSYHDYNERSKS